MSTRRGARDPRLATYPTHCRLHYRGNAVQFLHAEMMKPIVISVRPLGQIN
jgi:hypothetical protein